MNSYVKCTAFTYYSKQPKIKSVPHANIFSNKSVPKGLNESSSRDNFVREFIDTPVSLVRETFRVKISRNIAAVAGRSYFRQGRRLLSTHIVLSNGLIIVSTCSESIAWSATTVSPIESLNSSFSSVDRNFSHLFALPLCSPFPFGD